jgi:hypothetical protein
MKYSTDRAGVGVTVVTKHRFYLAPISNRGEHCQAAKRARQILKNIPRPQNSASRDD